MYFHNVCSTFIYILNTVAIINPPSIYTFTRLTQFLFFILIIIININGVSMLSYEYNGMMMLLLSPGAQYIFFLFYFFLKLNFIYFYKIFLIFYMVAFKSLSVTCGVVQFELTLLLNPVALIVGAPVEPLVVAKL